MARIVAASLAAGMAAALLLTLVVFAGGTESAITGSALRRLRVRVVADRRARPRGYTNQPQRWAAVPAVAMGGTGLALLVFTPGYDAMTAAELGVAAGHAGAGAWMFVQMRRSLTGAGRWLLTPVIAVLALAAVGATYENVSLVRDQTPTPRPGSCTTSAATGCTWTAAATAAPPSCSPTAWARSPPRGRGSPPGRATPPGSAPTTAPARAGARTPSTRRTASSRAEDLHALLAAAGETGPFVLVGHSTGGTYAMTYAARYPDQVAGMVLLDSSSPYQFTGIPEYAGQYAVMRRGLALLPTLSRLGLAGLAPASDLPAPAADQVPALTSTARAATQRARRAVGRPRVFAQAQALTTLDDRPLAVLTASEYLARAGWAGAQDQLAALSTNHVHRTVHVTHAGLLDDDRPRRRVGPRHHRRHRRGPRRHSRGTR